MKKKAIISVSFGTNDAETSRLNIDPLEADYKAAHPKCDIYRVITNDSVIEQIKEEGDPVYAVRECLARLVLDGVTHVYVQPAYLLNGTEFDELKEMIFSHTADFISVSCGRPLLSSQRDFEEVGDALMVDYPNLASDEAVVFISHGSDHHANTVYCALDYVMKDHGFENAYIGTFKAYPTVDRIIPHLQKAGIKKVHVQPFMFVAGQNAMEGVCGDAPDSMKSKLEAAGFTVEAHRKCLGENKKIRDIFVRHLDKCFED